jgi:hypothetical protein
MNEVDRLIEKFGARGKRHQSVWKLDVLMDLGRIDDPRVVRFLASVVVDPEEAPDVRTDALRRLRATPLSRDERALVAEVGLRALAPCADGELRLHAAVILGDFVDVDGVLHALGELAAGHAEPLELRYNAFTSLQCAGPTAACLEILQKLSGDEMLGQSARALLSAWGVD